MMPLDQRTAIITGASQGLGKELARSFLLAGANVILCARDGELLAEAAGELTEHCTRTGQLLWLRADVCREQEIEKLIEFAFASHKNIDILVNNAGIYGPKGCIEAVDWSEWTHAIEVNLYGPILMCRALLPHFKARSAGKIINISGGGATAPLPRLSAYAAGKAALVRLTETIAHETLGCGIDVNAVAPGALNTRMLDEVLAAGPAKVGHDFYDKALKQREQGGASMERAAALCVFLASQESNGITGRLLSALWDPWPDLPKYRSKLEGSDLYTLRRIVPSDRGENWENQ
jgi:3-oxoacyl-[acyl-carrier protein] reductase